MVWIVVLIGGALGSAARHGVNVIVARILGSASPYATATVNMIGSFVIGLLAGGNAEHRLHMTLSVRTFVFVGILGGFTTFSSFMLDSLTLFEDGLSAGVMANLVGQLVIGFVLVWIGYRMGTSTALLGAVIRD